MPNLKRKSSTAWYNITLQSSNYIPTFSITVCTLLKLQDEILKRFCICDQHPTNKAKLNSDEIFFWYSLKNTSAFTKAKKIRARCYINFKVDFAVVPLFFLIFYSSVPKIEMFPVLKAK